MPWLDPEELRIGLGCMRLAPGESVPIEVALEAGITVFDTARAYGDNERLVAGVLRARASKTRIVTKGGMTRPGGAWVPDGRAKAIAADCEASLEALGGLEIDLYLLHAPDPRTAWRTSIRALARLVDQGLVRRVGVANVNRGQLDEALELAPIAAVQVGVSPLDDRALRGGVVERCAERGLTVIAHSPLGGPRHAASLSRRQPLDEIAVRHQATAAQTTLAWLLGLSPQIVAIPGARKAETVRSAVRAAALQLKGHEQAQLNEAFGAAPRTARASTQRDGEVVIVMGIPGAGKTRLATDYVRRGYARLNRDERGGSLRTLAAELDERLSAGHGQIVLDNTYLTRAARSRVVETADRHGVSVRCVWLQTPLAQAQVNLVLRLLERFGVLPDPDQIREAGRREPWLMLPTSQMRALRELEPPSCDEGFAALETVAFERRPGPGGPGVFVAAAAVERPGFDAALGVAHPSAPHLVFDWNPDRTPSDRRAVLAAGVTGTVETAVCPHPAGPPACWCRPPLPGLPLAFAKAHAIDPARAVVIGCSPAHRTLANTLNARYVAV